MGNDVNSIVIDLASGEDFEEVTKLLKEITTEINSKRGWKSYSVVTNTDEQKEIFLQNISAGNKVFVARIDGHIIGVVNVQLVFNIRHGWRRAHLEEVTVRKDYQHQGIGSKLITRVIEYCKSNNIKVIKLLCGEQLLESQKFYEKNGFVCKDKGYRLELKSST